ALAGYADHGALQHPRVLVQRVLDLDRRDVLAAGDDHVLGAVHDVDVAALVDRGQVARVEPTVLDRLVRLPRLAPVPLHDHVGARQHLPDLFVVGLHSVAVLVGHLQVDPDHRYAGTRQDL